MKASSESGECANLISKSLPGAGFVGIAFCVHSLSNFSGFGGAATKSLGPDQLPGTLEPRFTGATPAKQRGTSEAESNYRKPHFECKRVAHSAIADNWRGAARSPSRLAGSCGKAARQKTARRDETGFGEAASFRYFRNGVGTLGRRLSRHPRTAVTCPPPFGSSRFRTKLGRRDMAASTDRATRGNAPKIRNKGRSARHTASIRTHHSFAHP